MSVRYKVIEKGRPGVVGGGEKKFYATIVRSRPVMVREFIHDISDSNTLKPADVLAVLEMFLELAGKYLTAGRKIDMGQLGSFSPSIQSYGEETGAEVTRRSIRRLKVNFRPSEILQDKLSTTKFEKVSLRSTPDAVDEGQETEATGQAA